VLAVATVKIHNSVFTKHSNEINVIQEVEQNPNFKDLILVEALLTVTAALNPFQKSGIPNLQ
jgi:hypothetical protein